MTRNISQTLSRLELSLKFNHPSMMENLNPVLTRARNNDITTCDLAQILAQYSVLPAVIVDFLSIGSSRLQTWPVVKEELERNIGEERGSRTDGIPHYVLLKAGLYREIGLDVSTVQLLEGTLHFLHLVRTGLFNGALAFTAGMVYALEASAIPELGIVARLINQYALMTGHLKPAIKLNGLSDWKAWSKSRPLNAQWYSLSEFFATHMFDFEVGHRNRLATALSEYISSERELQEFEEGFEYLLNCMDEWWDSLALLRSSETIEKSRMNRVEMEEKNLALAIA